MSLPSWEKGAFAGLYPNGAVARLYPMEKCLKFYDNISFLFTHKKGGSVHAGYYETGDCSGPAAPIYGDILDHLFFLPKSLIQLLVMTYPTI